MPVLTDNCVLLSVKTHALFVLNGELVLTTLNKQFNTIFVNLRGAFIYFILCDIILSSKVCFERIALGLFFHFDIFIIYVKYSYSGDSWFLLK